MEGDTLRYWRWKKNNTLSHMTVSFDRCCRPRNLINSFGSRKATADTVVPYFLFLHIWQKLLVSAYNCYYVYRKKEGKARASVSYARLTSFPHTKRGLFLHSLVLRLLRLHQCTREEFNSFCARVEEGWPPRNCLDNCLLCKWKQQTLLSAKAIYYKRAEPPSAKVA